LIYLEFTAWLLALYVLTGLRLVLSGVGSQRLEHRSIEITLTYLCARTRSGYVPTLELMLL
jgi:hypothetical protein